ncbi:uncharacterized protein LOC128724509 [Anopheles nili]|uniref:uncharacterized protein LOC128724509 n=1 Tax=Anopheles nili TaxID=185578 RepID=UPI00237B02A3|nr:uncharacterized protein LOC128724509 [Anopheles nili]
MAISIQECDYWKDFFRIYHDLPILWSTPNKRKPKHLKDRALNILLRKYREVEPSATINAVKSLLKNLRTQFRYELRLALDHELKNDNNTDAYNPSLWFFHALNFLRSEEMEILKVKRNNSNEHPATVNGPENSIELYCKSLMMALRKLDTEQLTYAKYHIACVLKYGRIGLLSYQWPQWCVDDAENETVSNFVNGHTMDANEGFNEDIAEYVTGYRIKHENQLMEDLTEQDTFPSSPYNALKDGSFTDEKNMIEEDIQVVNFAMDDKFDSIESADLFPSSEYTLATMACHPPDGNTVSTENIEITVIDMEDVSGSSAQDACQDPIDEETANDYVDLSPSEASHPERIFRRQCRAHVSEYVNNVVPTYNDEEFLENFRIGRQLVQMLCLHLETTDAYKKLKGHGGYEAISAQTHVLAFLWFLGHEKVTYRDVANRFSLSVSCLHDVIWRVSESILSMEQQVIVHPDEEKKCLSSLFFASLCNISGVIGCVGGTQIKIDKPVENAERYFLQRGYYSIQLQAIIDENMRFVDVFIEYPGEPELLPFIKSVCHEPYCLLGGSAYPCLPQLLVPYCSEGIPLTDTEKAFNGRIEAVTSKYDRIFLFLKQRFRQLLHLKGRHLSRVVKLIKVCCILHNLMPMEDIAQFESEIDYQNHTPIPATFTYASLDQLKSELFLGQRRRDLVCANCS